MQQKKVRSVRASSKHGGSSRHGGSRRSKRVGEERKKSQFAGKEGLGDQAAKKKGRNLELLVEAAQDSFSVVDGGNSKLDNSCATSYNMQASSI